MYGQILVPLKHDPIDDLVVEHVGDLARLSQAKVTLLHVVHSHSRDEFAHLDPQAREYMAAQAARLRARGLSVDVRVALGEPAATIAAVANETVADLIVMATHGHSGMHRVLVGSVTQGVIRQSGSPVLLLRPGPD